MAMKPLAARLTRRAMVRSGLKRSAMFAVDGRQITFSPLKRQSRLLDQLVEEGLWSYEPELSTFVHANPFGYRHFIDGGAHIALFSMLAECSGKYRRITAVEASPETASYIRRFKDENGLRFELSEAALGAGEGSVTFEIPQTGYVMPSHAAFTVSDLYRTQAKRKVTVATRPLSAFLSSEPTLLKLDCEGAEEDILRASLGTLTERRDIDIIVEIMINDANRTSVFDLLRAAGYGAYLMTNGGLVREDRPLTLPVPGAIPKRGNSRTIWRNHFFSKRDASEVETVSLDLYGYYP